MSNLTDSYFPPPRSWDAFEALVFDVFTQRLRNSNLKRYGRNGQAQRGVDIIGQVGVDEYVGIQCKNHPSGSVTNSEIDAEIAKAEAFSLPLTHYIIATSAPRDTNTTDHVFAVSNQRQQAGLFSVEIFFWEDLCHELVRNPEFVRAHFPDLAAPSPAQPKIDVTFAGGQTTATLAADWQSEPPQRKSGIAPYLPIWLWYTPGKTPGTTPLMLRVENQTVIEAKNVEVIIQLPEGSEAINISMLPSEYETAKEKCIKRGDGQITIRLPSLFHKPAFETEVVHIAFPAPNTSYELAWVATAGNMLGEQRGTLLVNLLAEDVEPTSEFPK